MDVEVHRLRVVLRADGMSAARSRRLALVASRALPAALDRCLAEPSAAPGADVEVPRLHVRLEVDPCEHDDETLAVLWADGIRRALLADLAGRAPGATGAERGARPASGRGAQTGRAPAPLPDGGADPAPAPAPGTPAPPAIPAEDGPQTPTPADAVARAVTALRALLAGPPGRAATGLARLLDSPATATAVVARLSDDERRRLVELARSTPVAGVAAPEAGPSAVPRPSASSTGTSRPQARERPPVDAVAPGARDEQTRLQAARDAVLTLARRASGPDSGVPVEPGGTRPDVRSRVGGLLLLYPWLPRYCGTATAGAQDEVAARRSALALLAASSTDAPYDGAPPQALLQDPLVALLAGEPRWAAPPELPATTPEAVAALQAAAADVLRTFAGQLPGFGRSSADYVREQWVQRGAVLQPLASEGLRVVLARRPLDVVLDRLPYPLGLLRLPWTPPLHVAWEPAGSAGPVC